MNAVLAVLVFSGIILVPEGFIAAIFGAMVLILANKKDFSEIMKSVEWEILFFFTSLFIMIGILSTPEVGFLNFVASGFKTISGGNGLLAVLLVFIISSALSAVISNAPVMLVFLPIIDSLIALPAFAPLKIALASALLLGVNIGGNFLPQGAACDIMTLTLAKKNNVDGFTYKSLFKVGGSFAAFHFALCCGFLVILVAILAL